MKILIFVSLFAIAAVMAFMLNLTRPLELRALSAALNYGSGWDDAAQELLSRYSSRYAPAIIGILASAEPGSPREELALNTVEMVINQPGAAEALRAFGCSHPDPETVSLAADILNSPVKTVTIGDHTGGTIEMVMSRSKPVGSLEEEHQRLGCGPE